MVNICLCSQYIFHFFFYRMVLRIGICSFINGDISLGWQGLLVGIVVAVIPQALTLWGEEGLLGLKELLGRI